MPRLLLTAARMSGSDPLTPTAFQGAEPVSSAALIGWAKTAPTVSRLNSPVTTSKRRPPARGQQDRLAQPQQRYRQDRPADVVEPHQQIVPAPQVGGQLEGGPGPKEDER